MSDDQLLRFASDLHQEILAAAGNADNPRLCEEIFTEQVLQLLCEHNEVDAFELCGMEAKSSGRTPAAKLNAWALDSEGATLDLFVTLYHGTGQVEEVGKPAVRRQFELVQGFLRRALDGLHEKMEESSSAFLAARKIHEARETLSSVRLFFLTDGVVRTMDVDPDRDPTIDVKHAVWDLQKLSQLKVGDRSVIELDFTREPCGALPCIEVADATDEYRTFLAFLPATVLGRIYGEYGQRLLERNVRAFLQARGKVNRGLQATLREEPHRFLAYNNGLCCTAAEVRITRNGESSPKLEWARDFQIVNGGQTTASIYHAMKKQKLDLAKVMVQVKLTVLKDATKIPEIVPLISRYANSQNKVNAADFAAHGPFHLKLEEFSRTVWAPAKSGLERGTHWYYERARGSYLDDKGRQATPAQRKNWEAQNPTSQKFTKTDLAKFVHAWTGAPNLVCLGAEKSFQRFAELMERTPDLMPEEDSFKRIVALAVLFRTTETVVARHKFGGWRPNITAYTVSWFAMHVEQRLNLANIWQQQELSSPTCEALNTICQKASEHLNATPVAGGNVGEWSKQEKCWDAFSRMRIPLSATIQKELVAPEEVWSFWRGFSRQLDEEERKKVMAVASEHWFELAGWAKANDVLEPKQRGIAFSLGILAKGRKEPSRLQIAAGIKILRDAQDEGFKAP